MAVSMSDGHYVIDPGSAIVGCFPFRGGIYDYSAASADIFHLCHADLAIKFALPNVPGAAGDAKYTMEVSVFSMWV